MVARQNRTPNKEFKKMGQRFESSPSTGAVPDTDIYHCPAANDGSRLEKELLQAEDNVMKLQADSELFREDQQCQPTVCHSPLTLYYPVPKHVWDIYKECETLRKSYDAKVAEVSQLMIENKTLREKTISAEEYKARMESRCTTLQNRLKELENSSASPKSADLTRDLENSLREVAEQKERVELLLIEATEMVKDKDMHIRQLRMKYLDSQRKLEEQRQVAERLIEDNKHIQEDLDMRQLCRNNSFQQEVKLLAHLASKLKKTRASLQQVTREKIEVEQKCTDLAIKLDAALLSSGDMEAHYYRMEQESEELKKLVALLRLQHLTMSDALVAASHHVSLTTTNSFVFYLYENLYSSSTEE